MNERNTNNSRPTVRPRKAPQSRTAFLTRIPMLTLVILFGFVFLIIMVSCNRSSDSIDTNPVTPEQTQQTPVQTEAPIGTTAQPQTEPPVTDSKTPVISTEPSSTEAVTTEPVTTAPPATEAPAGPTMTTVDDRYFADALFLGDSRTDGLFLYSTPGDCKHYPFPATSMTIYKIMDSSDEEKRYGFSTTRDLLKGMQFGKIYLMFGINEVGYSTSSFAEQYEKVVKEIRSYQPDAIIYIQSILYVTQKHEANYPVFATANIKEKNEAIKKLANNVDTFYLEVNDCLNDGTDHLPSDYSGDGAHLKAGKYAIWHDYLLEHAIVDAKHPWEPEGKDPEGAEIEHP